MVKTRTDWNELFIKFERKYNPYPVQMSRAEVFGNALNDGLITDEEYKEAKNVLVTCGTILVINI